MFCPEDFDGITRACLLVNFLITLDSSEDAADVGDVNHYSIIIRNTNQFQLVAQYFSSGLLFHWVAQVMVDTKELLVIGSMVSCYEGIVGRYDIFICTINLHYILQLFQKCWALFVAFDVET